MKMQLFEPVGLKFEKANWANNPEFGLVDTLLTKYPELYDHLREDIVSDNKLILTGVDPDVILNSISLVIKEITERKIDSIPEDYLIEDTFWKVVKLILGNTKLSNQWWGIKT